MKIKDIKSKEVRDKLDQDDVNRLKGLMEGTIKSVRDDMDKRLKSLKPFPKGGKSFGPTEDDYLFPGEELISRKTNSDPLRDLAATDRVRINEPLDNITPRDYFAALAMQGILHSDYGAKADLIAKVAYVMADEMIKARKK